MNTRTMEPVWNTDQLKEGEEGVLPEKTGCVSAGPDRPVCGAECSSGWMWVMEVSWSWVIQGTHSSVLSWWKICDFYTVAEQMELWLMIHNLCSLTPLSCFLRAQSFIALQEAAEAREGTVPTSSLKSCLWQVFVYLFKFIHSTKKHSLSRIWVWGCLQNYAGKSVDSGSWLENKEGSRVFNKLWVRILPSNSLDVIVMQHKISLFYDLFDFS